MTDSVNNNEVQKSTRKGKTNNPNGRPKGSTNKISGASIIKAIEKYNGRSYEEQLAQNYAVCIASDDRAMIAKYDQMFLNKVVGDLTNIDMTTAGKPLQANFLFTPVELPEWGGNNGDSN